MAAFEGRWPPVYDADDLKKQIARLVQHDDVLLGFYEWTVATSRKKLHDVCQGDVVGVPSEVPVIDSTGQPAVVSHESGYWMVIGNSCDIDRDYSDVRWTQLVPLELMGGVDLAAQELSAMRSYTASRRFYVPPFEEPLGHYIADFTCPVAVDKKLCRLKRSRHA